MAPDTLTIFELGSVGSKGTKGASLVVQEIVTEEINAIAKNLFILSFFYLVQITFINFN